MDFLANNIRNVAVLGHQGTGKTTLVESLLSITSGKEKGSIERKNTVSDFTAEEKNRLTSCSLAVVPVYHAGHKINLIDIPGNDDFIYEAIGVTKSIKGAILLVDASKKVEVESIKHFKMLRKRGIPTIIYLNKMDKENINYKDVLEDVKEKLGKQCIPFALPIGHDATFDGFVNVVELKARKFNGKECVDCEIFEDKKATVLELHNDIMEQVALTDDALLDKFFGGEELTTEEIQSGLRKGVLSGDLCPVLVGSATLGIGLHTMLDMFIKYLPAPSDLKPLVGVNEKGVEVERRTDANEPFSAYVFKTTVDPYSGTISLLKINSGTLNVGDEVYVPRLDNTFKVSNLFFVSGKEQTKTDKAFAGDIVAISKLDDIDTGDTLCDPDNIVDFKAAHLPTAVYFRSLEVANKKDEDKLNASLNKILKESPCIVLQRNTETKQLLIGGLSDTHLAYIAEKIKNSYGIQVVLGVPRVVYRETIKGTAEAEGRYVKQSGGSGFYGVVQMRFGPNPDGDENIFTEEVHGMNITKQYFPAVEKGFYKATASGPLAGFPVIGVKATLLDGKEHSVDSNETAFMLAASIAFKDAYKRCNPIILEPIMKITINVDGQFVGSIMSDLSTRRGRILNMEEAGDGTQNVVALVPESEILDYVTSLRVMTQGSGFFNREFDSYQRVPAEIQEKVIAEASMLKDN